MSELRDLTEEEIEDILTVIGDEGFDDYLESRRVEKDLEGTPAEPFLHDYLLAKQQLEETMRSMGLDF